MVILEKVLRVVFLFRHHPVLSADQIRAELSLSRSTAYRYVRSLVQAGLLEPANGLHRYRLGVRLLELGELVSQRLDLRSGARPFMQELTRKCGETVVLTVRRGHVGVCLDRVESHRLLRLTLDPGTTQPLYCGAPTKILMAYLVPKDQEEIIRRGLKRYTPNTITDPRKLRRRLAEIAQQGWTYSNQEFDLGAGAVAAPVRDYTGEVVAGLSIVGPAERLRGKMVKELIPLVVEYSKRISQALGWPPHAVEEAASRRLVSDGRTDGGKP